MRATEGLWYAVCSIFSDRILVSSDIQVSQLRSRSVYLKGFMFHVCSRQSFIVIIIFLIFYVDATEIYHLTFFFLVMHFDHM